MDDREAIPSGDDDVVIPVHLRERLQAVAERRLREACDLAFSPDTRDEVIAAARLVIAFEAEHVTRAVALELLPDAFDQALTDNETELAQELIALRNVLQEPAA